MTKKKSQSTEFAQEFGIFYSVQQIDAQTKDMPKRRLTKKKKKKDEKS